MKSSTHTTVKGQDLVDRFLKEIKQASTSYVTIGLHEDAGTYPPDKDGESVSVVSVALWTEFGTQPHGKHPGTPEYAWMRKTMDENQDLIERWRNELMSKVMMGEMTLEKSLEAMGFRLMTLLQNTIKSNLPPPNKPSTAAEKTRKGVAVQTLIDTGLMLRSITYRVVIQ